MGVTTNFSVFMDKFTGGLCVTILVAKQAQAAKHVLVEMFDVMCNKGPKKKKLPNKMSENISPNFMINNFAQNFSANCR